MDDQIEQHQSRACYVHAQTGDCREILDSSEKAYFEKMLPLQDWLKAIGKPVRAVKHTLELRGFQVGQTRKPPGSLSEKLKEAVSKTLEAIVLI
jgi:dihydrodipicolinate synthase/N-acetylneuraminate lyase